MPLFRSGPAPLIAALLAWPCLGGTPAAAAPAAAKTSVAPPKAGADDGASRLRLELGLFGGAHLFAKDLELGTVDEDPAGPTSPKGSGLFGLRAAVTYLPWVSFESEVVGIPTADRRDGRNAYVIGYRAHALAHLLRGPLRPFVVVGAGLLQISASDGDGTQGLTTDTDGELHAGLGVKYDLAEQFALRLDLRSYLLPNNVEFSYSRDYEILFGASYSLGGGPRSAAPAGRTAAPAPLLASNGDFDSDGIDDVKDECPRRPEDKDGFEDADGCPDKDNDHDGILDAADKCPDDAEIRNGIDDEDGCPEKDPDGDKVVGAADRCPDAAEDVDCFEDGDGCPDLDNDKDGVADSADRCPAVPETRNGFEDADGCPDELPGAVKRLDGPLLGVSFRTGKAELRSDSRKALDDVAKVLKEMTAVKIRVAGHTATGGARDKAVKLSKDRAEAVKAYLVKAGIDAARIETAGHGPARPIAPNLTRRGRAQNERIELEVLSR